MAARERHPTQRQRTDKTIAPRRFQLPGPALPSALPFYVGIGGFSSPPVPPLPQGSPVMRRWGISSSRAHALVKPSLFLSVAGAVTPRAGIAGWAGLLAAAWRLMYRTDGHGGGGRARAGCTRRGRPRSCS